MVSFSSNSIRFQNALLREQIYAAIRAFFVSRNYHEVEVPLLSDALIPESYLEVFESTLLDRNRHPSNAYLTPSPEIFLKKLLVARFGDCFTITKSFRNTENLSSLHNPEFSMLEWYRVGADYLDLMAETEELFVQLYKTVIPTEVEGSLANASFSDKLRDSSATLGMTIKYQGQTIDLSAPWERLTMIEAFKKHADLDLEKMMTFDEIIPVAQKKGYSVSKSDTWEQIFHKNNLIEVEPKFGQGKPTIIYDFPSQMAALAKKKSSDPRFAERFEIFIAGLEIGDAYTELTDWKEQAQRFTSETEERKRLGKTAHPADDDFIDALKKGLPECAGMALGLDRLVMLFANAKTIQEVLLFPASELWR